MNLTKYTDMQEKHNLQFLVMFHYLVAIDAQILQCIEFVTCLFVLIGMFCHTSRSALCKVG